jgi:hypothetical protein
MAKKKHIKWFKDPQERDYPSAESYLRLLLNTQAAAKIVGDLVAAEMTAFAAKDIFRASELPLLDENDSHVKKEAATIVERRKLSPLLLMRGRKRGKLTIADGYHRLCAVYSVDEDAMIPCKIV